MNFECLFQLKDSGSTYMQIALYVGIYVMYTLSTCLFKCGVSVQIIIEEKDYRFESSKLKSAKITEKTLAKISV